jgi:prephenate dehydrogenase
MTAGRSSSDPRPATTPVTGGAANRRAAAGALPDRIAFLGLGLIGGSIAKALREAQYGGTIAAWSPAGTGPSEGHRAGVVDEAAPSPDAAMAGAGLVVLAGPPISVLEALDGVADARRAGLLAPDATITDVASTKAAITTRAAELELPFVGGHPMAGREVTGFAESDAGLFLDRPWVIVPARVAEQRHVVRTTALAWAAGARPIELTAAAHDAAVAAISHVPLVVSAALVEAVGGGRDWAVARSLAASGWASATRLAKGDPEMGAGILATNAGPVADGLRAIRAAIDVWLEALEAEGGPDEHALRARLEGARRALDPDAT